MSAEDRQLPDFIAVGHVTLDLARTPASPTGHLRPGGTAAYAALTARRLGRRAGVVTSTGAAWPSPEVLAGVPLRGRSSGRTAKFVNDHRSGQRTQVPAERAAPIELASPKSGCWRR